MRLLLIEDKDSFRRLLVQALQGTPWQVRATGDPEEGLRWLDAEAADVLVTDLRLPGLGGLEVIRRARRLKPDLRVVLMSAFGEPRDIVEAMRLGAEDFLPKPFDLEVFLALLERLGALAVAPPPDPEEPWVALSPAMRTLDQDLSRAADSDAPVVFWGPSGSGRGRFARRLHTLRRPRGPFLTRHGAELEPEDVGGEALRRLQGGTLLIAHAEAMAPARVQEVLRAADAPLGQGLHWMLACGRPGDLPEALALRFGVLTFEVPALARRREDLLPLFRAFLLAEGRRLGRPAPSLDRVVERQILVRAWDGQLQELAATARRVMEGLDGLMVRSLPEPEPPGGGLPLPWPERAPLEAMLKAVGREAERQLLIRALGESDGDLPAAAAALGLTVRTLGQRLRDHRVPLEDEGPVTS